MKKIHETAENQSISISSLRISLKSCIILSICTLFSACKNNASVPVLADEANNRIAITNNLNTLNARVINIDETINIENTTPQPLALSRFSLALQPGPSVTLTLLSEIRPPIVEGETVQATSVSLSYFNTAIVSYNMQGAQRLGAIDWVSRYSNGRPRLTSGVTFNDSDINAVSTDGSFIYTALATDDPLFTTPAAMERLKIRFLSVTLLDNNRKELSSFAGTSVLPTDNVIYAISGNEGHITAFDPDGLSQLAEFALHDARWAALDEDNNRVVVAQGTPGILSVFEHEAFSGGSMTLLNSFPFPGATVAESKSTVEIAGGKAFIAAGPDGVQIMCLDDGQIIGTVPRPDPASLGLDPAVVVTNAVSVDDDLMFISNGEAGVYVAQGSQEFDSNNCDTQSITVLGKINFDNLQSANHVAYKSGFLYVAAGLGGVKVVKVKVK